MTRTILILYALTSVIAFFLYGFDKRRARKGGCRIPEVWLHGFELFGGFPGAFLGQRVFHHKTRKVSFQIVFWLIVIGHAAFWVWWWTRGGETPSE